MIEETIQQYNIFDLGFNKYLTKGSSVLELATEKISEDLPLPSILGSGFYEIPPGQIGSGEMVGNFTLVVGLLQSSNFVSGSVGWRILYDGTVEFNSGVFRGSLVAGSIHIPDENSTANSFHADSDGNAWWGCTHANFDSNNDNANAYILATGVAKFQSVTIVNATVTTPTIIGGTLAIGSSNNIFKADANGIYLGNATFGSAPFSVSMAGALVVTSATITGAIIKVGGDSAYNVLLQNSLNSIRFRYDTTVMAEIITLYDVAPAGGISIICDNYTYQTKVENYGSSTQGNMNYRIYNGSDWKGFSMYRDVSDSYMSIELTDLVPALAVGGNLGTPAHIWNNSYINNLNVGSNIVVIGLVDGVDIAAFKTSYDSHNGGAITSYHSGTIGTSMHGTLTGIPNAHHTKYTDANARSGVTGTALPGNLVLGNNEVNDVSFLKFDDSYGQIYWGGDLVEDFYSAEVRFSKNVVAATAGSQNLGSAGQYWNDISYKTLTDRGCLGVFDAGVKLQDGRMVSDIEALKSIQKHPTLMTDYGVPRFDYSTMPKAVYKPAPIAESDIYEVNKKTKKKVLRWKKGQKMGEDGAETTALISILIGAVKELSGEIELLKQRS